MKAKKEIEKIPRPIKKTRQLDIYNMFKEIPSKNLIESTAASYGSVAYGSAAYGGGCGKENSLFAK